MVAMLGLPCCACIFTSCGKQGALYVEVLGFSLWGLPLLQNSGSRCTSFNSCMGLVVPWHVGSSQTRDGTLTCIGRLILNHWTTGEVPYIFVWRTGKHQIWKACDLWRGKNLSSWFWSVREELQERDFLGIISMHSTGIGYCSWIPSPCPQGRLFQKGDGFHVGSFIHSFCFAFLILISIWDQFWKFQPIDLSWGSNFKILLGSLHDQSG